jgi:tail protein
VTAYCSTPATLRLELTDPTTGAVTNTLDLMDGAGGYRVSSLDLGWPAVRQVVAALPTRDGDYDTTRLFGSRIVTVVGSIVPTPAMSRQSALGALGWWLQPALRPRLVYAVDPANPPVRIGLVGSQLASPFVDPTVSAFTASWVAPDPAAYGLTQYQVFVSPASILSGRTYPRTYPLSYPTGSGGTGVATVTNNGTYRTWPVFRIFGPCTDPAITYLAPAVGAFVTAGLSVAAGDYVTVDTRAATVYYNGDPTASRYSTVDFTRTTWAPLPPGTTQVRFAPVTWSSPCQLEIDWSDAYLT